MYLKYIKLPKKKKTALPQFSEVVMTALPSLFMFKINLKHQRLEVVVKLERSQC